MLVNGGQPCNFNYASFSQESGLDVAALIYDVTTGTPSLVGPAIGMPEESNGVYVGSFTPAAGHSYLVIKAVFTDGTFATADTDFPPSADNYDAFTTNTAKLNFNYGAYDQEPGLTINATVYNLTDATQSTIVMTYVACGVYFGQYAGVVGKSYSVIKLCTDPTRAPGTDSFQSFTISIGISVDPGVQNVLAGIVYEIDGILLTGTLRTDNQRTRLKLKGRIYDPRFGGRVFDEPSSRKKLSGRIRQSNNFGGKAGVIL